MTSHTQTVKLFSSRTVSLIVQYNDNNNDELACVLRKRNKMKNKNSMQYVCMYACEDRLKVSPEEEVSSRPSLHN